MFDRAKDENNQLEEELHERVLKLQSMHLELDEQKQLFKEQNDISAADDFFYSNKAILRAAYRWLNNLYYFVANRFYQSI